MLASDREDAFGWVDDYFAHVRSHFEVRAADSLLIVMPNRAVKLNPSGLRTLQWLKQGGAIDDLLAKLGPHRQRRQELFVFLCDVRSLLTGCLGEGQGRKAVEKVPQPQAFNTLPVLSEVAVTYRCNLRCQFCYAACGCHRAAAASPELSTRQVLRVLRSIRHEAQVPSVSFTGGEPLLRPDLESLVRGAVGLGLRVNLITNGTLLADDDRAARLQAAGLSSAQVSLEGPSAAVHDELTGVTGSFARTLAGLQALARAGVHVHTNTTVNTLNARHLPALVRRVAGLGMKRLSMNLVIPAGQAASLAIQVTYRDAWAAIAPARDEARSCGVEFMWYSPTPMCILNPLAEGLGNKSCAACDGLLSVAPNGDVLPCSSYSQPVGNLLKQPFAEIWASAAAAFFRRKDYAPPECLGCGEFTACAGACPLYWAAMGTGELAGKGGMRHAVA
jgi:radical SAM protein with 4Fe4S-binding SPASM domain